MRRTDRTDVIAILGGNVAGATAAILLSRAGRTVHMFDKPSSLAPRVGESLLPSAVPILRRLVPEQDLQQIALPKPGQSFVLRTGRLLSFQLRELRRISATYTYNVPRPQFDDLLRKHAVSHGTNLINSAAKIHAEGDRILLDDESLALAGLSRQPDLVIDATGRAQLITRTLRGKVLTGGRSALSLYAHFRNVELGGPPGHAVISPMQHGWCWRIPLLDCTSVGIVMSKQHWAELGDDPRAIFATALRNDAVVGPAMRGAEQQSRVLGLAYQQYEAERCRGENWFLVGDAAGFTDPTLAPGVTIALQGAADLADCLTGVRRGLSGTLWRWEARCRRRLRAWAEIVDFFYDGSLFAIILQGEEFARNTPWLGPFNRHMKRSIGAAMVGVRTDAVYNLNLIRWLAKKGLVRYRSADWAIH